ncbi:MAG: hypothetical protein V3T48_05825 [Vicinamibacterales bacterium]
MTDLVIELTLAAVIISVTDGRPRMLTIRHDDANAIPSGPVSSTDTTLELALRRWIRDQAGIDVGYVEQLYTFGDLARIGDQEPDGPRPVSIAYVALVREESPAPRAEWVDCYQLLPWEDHRDGRPQAMADVDNGLARWASDDDERRRRVAIAFGQEPAPWDGVPVLERYELLYEASLVVEAYRDRAKPAPADTAGRAMRLDHRRMVATALGRIRGKLTYRPVVFELLPSEFTLLELQDTVEALAGIRLHKQNFRRLVDRNRLVDGTGKRATSTGGRPAELFRFRPEVFLERPRPGIGLPYRR